MDEPGWTTEVDGTKVIHVFAVHVTRISNGIPHSYTRTDIKLEADARTGHPRFLGVRDKFTGIGEEASEFLIEHGFGPQDDVIGWQFLTSRNYKTTRDLCAFLETYSKL